MKELKAILYEPNVREARQRVANFYAKWSDHNEGKLWAYLQKHYFQESRRCRWMKAYRTGLYYAGMDTNNYVESWHNQLKSHFLRGHNRGRGDRLIYVLSHDVDLFFQAEGMRSQVRFGRHSKGETFDKKQLKFLASKSQEDLQAMVIFLDGKCVVRSFSAESVLYNITINNNAIEGCNCDYSVKNPESLQTHDGSISSIWQREELDHPVAPDPQVSTKRDCTKYLYTPSHLILLKRW
jgi:hypothetical protein